MSQRVKAELVYRKELFNGIRFTEFKYTYYHNVGKKFPLFINTVDHDFKAQWVIFANLQTSLDQHGECKWNKIKLEVCDKNIFGNFTVQVKDQSAYTASFDSVTLPFEHDLRFGYCEIGSRITTTIRIYREDGGAYSIIENYAKFLKSTKSSDVVFNIEDEEISACKVILSSQSDVFAAMFDSDMTEKKTNSVSLRDIEPAIFKLLVRYMYTGKLYTNDADVLLKLFMAADKYAIQSLIDLCGYRISNNLTIDNAVDVLIAADRVRENFLKKDCMDFIIKYKNAIVDTEGFKSMVRSNADLLVEIFCRIN